MAFEPYSLTDVLAVAKLHPFYAPGIQYPPDAEAIQAIRERATEAGLISQPLLHKKDLYKTIERLVNDTAPENTYRHGVYTSTTGGGSGSKPMFFATDVHENRRHRAYFGRFVRATGVIKHGDWVVTVHSTGALYRSLDLTAEILENAGATVLCAGDHMSPARVCQLFIDYHANVLSGDSGQVVQMAHHISTLPQEERDQIKIDKIIYTSEVLTGAQRAHLRATLGAVKICSFLGSAEAGPWAVSSPDITGKETATSTEDFVFDTRTMLIEILDSSISEDASSSSSPTDAVPLPDGEPGVIVQTSLSRLRNPLVRYNTGDIGSLHPLPDHARATIPKADWPYFRILRLQGRDRRLSFDWFGDYFEFEKLTALLNTEECGILQWQVILDTLEGSPVSLLEIRLLCATRGPLVLSEEALVGRIRAFFHVYPANEDRFRITFINSMDGFRRSSTGRKVIKFVDVFNQPR